ncbi:hypothetical protein JXQ70_19380 [bacterium]|nr:hypothetical protein [bacterium]
MRLQPKTDLRYRFIYTGHLFILILFNLASIGCENIGLEHASRGGWHIVQGENPLPHFRAMCYLPDQPFSKHDEKGPIGTQRGAKPHHVSHMFVAGFDGIVYRSSDGFQTWQYSQVPGGERLYALHFDNKQKGYVAGWGGRLNRTLDGGRTWQAIDTGSTQRITGMDRAPDGHLFLIGDGGTVIRTASNDRQFEQLSGFQDQGLRAIAFNADGHGLIVGYRGAAWATHDSGKNWDELSGLKGFGSDMYSCAVNSTTAWVVGAFGHVFKANLEDDKWSQVDLQTRAYLRHITFISDRIGIITGYGTVFRTVDAGATWQQIISGVPYQLLASTGDSGSEVWTCGEYGCLYCWDGAGNTRRGPVLGIGVTIFDLASDDRNSTLWAVAEKGTVFHSRDQGQSWGNTALTPPIDLLTVTFSSDGLGYIGGRNGHYWSTQDGGSTWHHQQLPAKDDINDLAVSPTGTVWACGRNGLLCKSSDRGISWHSIPINFDRALRSLSIVHDDCIWVVGENGLILQSMNDGNFFFGNYSGTSLDLNAVYGNDRMIITAGQSGAVLLNISSGQGSSWDLVQCPGGVTFHALTVVSDQITWLAGDGGQLVSLRLDRQSGHCQRVTISPFRDLHALLESENTLFAGGSNSIIVKKRFQ